MENLVKEAYRKVAPHADDRTITVHHVDDSNDCAVVDDGIEVVISVTDFWRESVYKQGIATAGGVFTLSACQVFESVDYQVFRASWIDEGICSHVTDGYIAIGDSPATDPESCEGTPGHGKTMAEAMASVDNKREQQAATDMSQTKKDLLILVLRLINEDHDTFSPEALEVMKRWAPTAMQQFTEDMSNE